MTAIEKKLDDKINISLTYVQNKLDDKMKNSAKARRNAKIIFASILILCILLFVVVPIMGSFWG